MGQRPHYWKEMPRRKRNNRSPGKARRQTSLKWPTMAARLLQSRNCWPRSIHGSRSFQSAYAMFMGIRGGRFWNGLRKRTWLHTVQTWTERLRSISTAKPSLLSWRLLIDSKFGSLKLIWRLPVFLNHSSRLIGIFLAHQNHGTAHSGQDVLLRIERREIRVNAGGFEQAAYDHRFRFLFGIKHPHQLFIRIRTLSRFGSRVCHYCLQSG